MKRFSLKRLFVIVLVCACLLGAWRWLSSETAKFYFSTGLWLPRSSKVVESRAEYPHFNGDGQYYIVIDVPPKALKNWLDAEPPWSQPKWSRGPVPSEIESHTQLDLSSSRIWYAVRKRGQSSMPWHNGDVLAIDAELGRIWYGSWDM